MRRDNFLSNGIRCFAQFGRTVVLPYKANHRVGTSNGMSVIFHLIVLLLMILITSSSAHAQGITRNTWEVYLQRGIGAEGADRLTFIDVLLGEQVRVEAFGERYTILGNTVLYFDYRNQRVMQATAAGTTLPHPFIRLENGATRVDWVVSSDARHVAWTLTYLEGEDSLTTTTFVADANGTNRREVLQDGPRRAIRALPVAFSSDYSTLYMDAQPDGLGRFTAYPQYAGLFALDLATSDVTSLPGEPGCFCGAGFGGDWYLRLALPQDLGGFDVQIQNLVSGRVEQIPAFRILNFTQAGGLLISPDGERAVYALSQVEGLGTQDQFIRTVFMLVDLVNMTQADLNDPISQYLVPVGWTEDNTALLLVDPGADGTWKFPLDGGRLTPVADGTFLGRLGQRT